MTPLLSLLKSIQQQGQQLHDCMLEEKQALGSQQYDQLASLTEKKQSLIKQLDQLEQQRNQHCPAQNFSEYIAQSGDAGLIRQWNNTRGIIARCQKQNEVNGRLLHRQQLIQQDLISLMTGRRPEQQDTYSADGNQRKHSQLLGDIKA